MIRSFIKFGNVLPLQEIREVRDHTCAGVNLGRAWTIGEIIAPLVMHVRGEAGEIHCCAPSDNNGGFQRPQSLISSRCYQRFHPLERGRSTTPVLQPHSQQSGH